MCTCMPLGRNDVNSGDANEMNALSTSETNVLNALSLL